MSNLGVEIPPQMRKPQRKYALLASAIWLAVSLPFFYLAYLYGNWPESVFIDWRGWVFALVAIACVLMATVVPPRYRIAIVGTQLHGWGDLQ
jgi:hypothetical protein